MQEPLEIKLGQRMVLTRRVARPYLKVVHDVVYQVPFLESLQHLLSDDLVFEEVMKLSKSTITVYTCISTIYRCM